MEIRCSTERYETFVGDVFPLWLECDEDISRANIRWRVAGDAVMLRTFGGTEHMSFAHGVLCTGVKEGSATVTATLEGRRYSFEVTIRAARKAASSDPMNYYIGDLHDHTTEIHDHDAFAARLEDRPIDMIRQVRDEGKIDLTVVSDHGLTTNKRDFFYGFVDAERAKPMDLVVLAGCESEVNDIETDEYGVIHKNSGEVVTLNASSFVYTKTWAEAIRELRESPFAIAILAHPQICGFSVPGVWNFHLERNNSPELRRLVKLIEMGNGKPESANLVNEYVYSLALDNGFRVSTTCSSDSHGPVWGFTACPGKTVIMAPERSREAFIDALSSCRVYASESGNVKVRYSVNGTVAPAELALADEYRFRVEVGRIRENEDTDPVSCQVISDYGVAVAEVDCRGLDSFEVNVVSTTARWFYLRLIDGEGRRTWSPPVFCGRETDAPRAYELSPIEKSRVRVTDTEGADLAVLMNGDPRCEKVFEDGSARILIELDCEREICALGHYAPVFISSALKAQGRTTSEAFAEIASGYRIYAGNGLGDMQLLREGIFRAFGGEEVIDLPSTSARLLLLEVTDNVGRRCGRAQYRDAVLKMAELTVYTRK